jgi:thiamine-phosphate pyrophosphorylase
MITRLRGLYAITDSYLIPEHSFKKTIEKALSSGVKIIQYRDKSCDTDKRFEQARDIKYLCEKYNTTFIINDDVELAKEINADGVHIGANDSSYDIARAALGKDKIIGISCYNQFDLAKKAQLQGADYIAFGRFFTSKVKPDAVAATTELLVRAKQELHIPVCAIGGITLNNAAKLMAANIDMLAVITAIFDSDNIESTCQKFSGFF